MSDSELNNRIIQNKLLYKQLTLEHWVKYEVLTWQWWLGIACVIIPLLILWKLIDKKRLFEIMFFGLLINILAIFLDEAGSELVLWNYAIRIIPQIPLLFPVDYIILPTIYMLIYQHYKDWKPFLLASTLGALGLAFVAEPLAVYIKQYQLISWHFIYSFPIYIMLSILAKLITNKMLSRQEVTS
ncbi:MAG: hypothetical protein P4L49_05180 [Desulfosporosinus sp.]|nr:hypothetical protein [Desulfosporosinus sp.]